MPLVLSGLLIANRTCRVANPYVERVADVKGQSVASLYGVWNHNGKYRNGLVEAL